MKKSDHDHHQFTKSMNTAHHSSPTGLDIQNITKSFGQGAVALKNTSFTVAPGEMVALIGASGSGKSTLLRHVSGFLAADAGSGAIRVGPHTVQIHGQVHRQIRKMRSDIGFIFQQFNLVGRMNVLTNVMTGMLPRVPLWRSLLGQFTLAEKQEAYEALRMIGIEGLAYQRASTLSGGQQQRVAIARCMVQHAKIIGRRTHCLVGPRERQNGDGHPGQDQPRTRHHGVGFFAPSSICPALLPAHDCAAHGGGHL